MPGTCGREGSAGQGGRPHQELVDRAGALAALADRPDDQGLAAPHVAAGEDLGHRWSRSRPCRPATLPRGSSATPRLLEQARLARAEEAHGQQDQVGLQRRTRCPATSCICHAGRRSRTHSTRTHSSAVTVPSSPTRALGQHGPVALAAFLVAGGGAQLERPVRPGQRLVLASPAACGMISSWVIEAAPWRFEVPMQSEPVSPPPITTTCLPLARDRAARRGARLRRRRRRACSAGSGNPSRSGCPSARGPGPPGRAASRRRPPAPPRRSRPAATSNGRRRRRPRRRCGSSTPSASICAHAAVDQVLLHLEVGDAVAQQAADAVVLLEHASPHGRRAPAAARRPGRPGRSRRRRRACRSCCAGGCGMIQPSSQPAIDDRAFDRS